MNSLREPSPYVERLQKMWRDMREDVLDIFPAAPGIPDNKILYLNQVEDLYVTDAYHSMAIEGYKVNEDLINQVHSGSWKPSKNSSRNEMAAYGYRRAFNSAKQSIDAIFEGGNPGSITRVQHHNWFSELFSASIESGILEPVDLMGYRNIQVYIGGAKHVPPSVEAIRDMMPTLFDLIENEKEAAVRAVLGHFVFVYIHPYFDGNGRIGRLLMNAMLASGGYQWTVISVEQRTNYIAALEVASVEKDIRPFAQFIADLHNQISCETL